MNLLNYRDAPPSALIVDDDPLGLTTTAEMFHRLGIMSDVCSSSKEALAKAWQTAYTYIVLDIGMPELSGYQLCSEIRNSNSPSRNAFILALSGRIYDEAHVTQCLKVGMCDVLSKPLTQETLQRRMSYWHFAMRNADKLSSTQ